MLRRTAAIIVAGALVLAGCNDGEPAEEPHDPWTVDVSPRPTEETAEETTEAAPKRGPLKTVRAWVKAMGTLMQTGDPADIWALSTRTCDTCPGVIEPRVEVYENGGRMDAPDGWHIAAIGKDKDFAENRTVNTVIRYSAGTTWPSEGAEPIEYDAERHVIRFELREVNGEWLVDELWYRE